MARKTFEFNICLGGYQYTDAILKCLQERFNWPTDCDLITRISWGPEESGITLRTDHALDVQTLITELNTAQRLLAHLDPMK